MMTYGYSDDLRAKALAYYDVSGKSQAEVCAIFGVGVRTFAQWVRLRKAGDFRRRPQQKPKPARIDGTALAAYIDAHPDAYFREIALVFAVSDVGILKACRRLGITRKKNSALRRARRSGAGDIQRRGRADSAGNHRVGR
jgi:transposase